MTFKDFVNTHLRDDVYSLALQADRYDGIDVRSAIVQIRGWQIAEKKLPAWAACADVVYPEHLSMEQCSSQQTAEYKSRVLQDMLDCADGDFADLTGGFGVDGTIVSRLFHTFHYVERNTDLCRIASNNLKVMGVPGFEVHNTDAETFLNSSGCFRLLFADPARRDENGSKVVSIADCSPDVASLLPQMKAKSSLIMLKLSPMIDIKDTVRLLGGVAKVFVVSVSNECKEVVVVVKGECEPEKVDTGLCNTLNPSICCVNLPLPGDFSFSHEEENSLQCEFADVPHTYLYEPNASLLKAGAFKVTACRYGLAKIHPSSHLYTSDVLAANFPGRVFVVEGYSRAGGKDLKSLMSDLKKANVSVRNFPLTADMLKKKLKVKDGGDTYIFGTTLNSGEKVIVRCRKCAGIARN
jgi:hypothetical protein